MNIQRLALCVLIISLASCIFNLDVSANSLTTITEIISPLNKNSQPDTSSVHPGTKIVFPLTAEMFSWTGSPGNSGEPVTRTQLRNSNIAVKYTCNQTKVVKGVSLDTTIFNGAETACVKLEFADKFESVKPLDFKLTLDLTINGTRSEASDVIIHGTFENEVIEIDSSYDYISIADGKVLTSSDYIANLEISIGADVQLFTRLQASEKYYARAKNVLTNADDQMLSKYPEIETAVRIKTINLRPTGNCVLLKDIGQYSVYSGTGVYLGTTADRLPFHELYYLTSKKITMQPEGAGEESKSPGGSVGAISGNTPEESAAQKEMANAAGDALASGAAAASVAVRDVEKITPGELQAMFDAAALAKMKAQYIADTTSPTGSGVQGRIEINPALAVKLNKDVSLGVYTSNSAVENTVHFIEKHYSNRIRVVHLSQEGSYGMTAKIAAKVDMEGFDLANLHLYSYDKRQNSFKSLTSPKSYVDKNGYLHFSTVFGNEIIVSDGPLRKRG